MPSLSASPVRSAESCSTTSSSSVRITSGASSPSTSASTTKRVRTRPSGTSSRFHGLSRRAARSRSPRSRWASSRLPACCLKRVAPDLPRADGIFSQHGRRRASSSTAGPAQPSASPTALPLKELLGAEGDVHRALRDDPGGDVDAYRHARERHRNAAQTESAAQDWPFVVEAGDRAAAPSDVAAVSERRQLADEGRHQQRLPKHVDAPLGVHARHQRPGEVAVDEAADLSRTAGVEKERLAAAGGVLQQRLQAEVVPLGRLEIPACLESGREL